MDCTHMCGDDARRADSECPGRPASDKRENVVGTREHRIGTGRCGIDFRVLIVTGNPRLPSDPDSAAQDNPAQTTTTTLPAHGSDPLTPAAKEVAAWISQYEDNMRALGTDEEGIDVADDELKGSSGGHAAHNYSTALSAAQHLSSDVAIDQKVPAIPDPAAQSDWSTELSDLAVAAAAYFQGFTDTASGKTAAGTVLIQQGERQVNQAEIRANDLVSRLSAVDSG